DLGPRPETAVGRRELWPWLAALALLVLLLEWGLYHRRPLLPPGLLPWRPAHRRSKGEG
ncbi:MAG: hypothetical protein GYA17_20305, partial [Chloroflexi bacterium]|nr:hypothetical protein [Chloroflexota bacterium]